MPPRNTQLCPPQGQGTVTPGAPSRPSDLAPAHRSQRARTQAVPAQGEFFNLSEVSSDDDADADNNNRPAHQSGSRTQQANPPAQEQDSSVNDPNLSALSDSKTATADIRHFFEKLADKTVCKECR